MYDILYTSYAYIQGNGNEEGGPLRLELPAEDCRGLEVLPI